MKRASSKPPGIRLSLCLPAFLVGLIVINLLVVALWMNRDEPKGSHIHQHPALDKFDRSSLVNSRKTKAANAIDAVPNPAKRFETDAMIESNSNNEKTEMENKQDDNQNKADAPIATVAHVVSLIKCSKSVTGFLDAAAVFRHSIHLQSFATGKSKYAYQMYAIVHEQCRDHGAILERLGYIVLIKASPVQVSEIKGKWYREHVEHENCCGSAEFIKLYAYELTSHEIVVHWDMDVAVLAPMDDLYDAMLFSRDSPEGKAARGRLELQHPEVPLPDQIDAYFTRDVTSAQPWEKHQGVQGGFVVARPSLEVLKTYIEFIRLGNYTGGRGDGSGWNAMGYGGFQGAMAYQGVVAFFYDYYRPNTAVELAVCRWNQVVADVFWRGPQRMEHHMQCREYPKDGNHAANINCEDCRTTPIDLVKTVHYTACKKPWECALPHPRVPKDKSQVYRLSHLTNITTCGLLFRKWFELRNDLEQQLQKFDVEPAKHDGPFNPEYFMGYCSGVGGYIPMNPPPERFDMKQIYGNQEQMRLDVKVAS